MSEVKRWSVDGPDWELEENDYDGGLVIYEDYDKLKAANGDLQLHFDTLKADYDQLKADYAEIESALVTKNHEAHDLEIENRQLKAENERLRIGERISAMLVSIKNDERDALRKQLDEARELLEMAQSHANEFVYRDIYAWLGATKP